MPRSAPSRADQELLEHLADNGLRCSAYQLQRWRQHGLLPRARVYHLGAHGNASVHPTGTRHIAEVLAHLACPGFPWQRLGIALISVGYVQHLDLEVIKACLTFCLDAVEAKGRERVRRATADIDPAHRAQADALDYSEVAAHLRSSRSDRATYRQALSRVKRRYPDWPARQKQQLARASIAWNIAHMLGEDLEDDLLALAHGWSSWQDMRDHGWEHMGLPTLDESRTTVRTLTRPEFDLSWEFVDIAGVTGPMYGPRLAAGVAQLRYGHSASYDQPIPDDRIAALRLAVAQWRTQERNADGLVDSP